MVEKINNSDRGNKSVIKALEILDYLGRTKGPAHLKDIANALNLPESTTHRLLVSISSKHFIQQSENGYRYNLGWKIVTLANSMGIYGQLPQLVKIPLKTLANKVKQSVNLSTLAGRNVVYFDSINPNESVTLYTPPGSIVPAHASAMGKAQLAYLSNEEIMRLYPDELLEKVTNNTITSTKALISEIETVRKLGHALDRGEFDPYIQCVGAAICDSTGTMVAGVSISVISAELSDDWYLKYLPELKKTCRQISKVLCA
jgi:DNA-binding IclR family transcriptional regulator